MGSTKAFFCHQGLPHRLTVDTPQSAQSLIGSSITRAFASPDDSSWNHRWTGFLRKFWVDWLFGPVKSRAFSRRQTRVSPMPARVTIRDIAHASGLSKSTVALVLKEQPGPSPATCAKVRAVADRLGYLPDPALSHLASHRWQSRRATPASTLAAILPHASKQPTPLWAGVEEAAARLGYKVDWLPLSDYGSFQPLPKILRHRGIRGVLLPPLAEGAGFRRSKWDGFTLVALTRGNHFFPVHAVAHDTFTNARLCWRKVQSLGYRRIGAAPFRHPEPMEEDVIRYGAFTACAELENSRAGRIPVFNGLLGDRAGFLRWVRRWRPDVVIGFNVQCLRFLQEEGIRVPEEMAFATLHSGISNLPEGPLAGMMHIPHRIGMTAVEFMDELIRHNQHGLPSEPHTVLLQQQWRDGYSCPARAGEG